jgi:hypothetical protein
MEKSKSSTMLIDEIKKLNKYHFENCQIYAELIKNMGWLNKMENDPLSIYLHCNLFKYQRIQTGTSKIEDLVLTSSGTTSKLKSKIYTDFETRIGQQKALRKIMTRDIIKQKTRNLPYYVISSNNILNQQNAKYAAVKGFSMLSKEINFLLTEQGTINDEILEKLVSENGTVLLFGFTYDMYRFLKTLDDFPEKLNMSSSKIILLHGGGWKKMEEESVTNEELKSLARRVLLQVEVINYYGMIEQPGSIYVECSHGFFHEHEYGTIITRDTNLEEQENGRDGIVQVISSLPKSYPGHSILTEDVGTIFGQDCCKCGKLGKYFKIRGRLRKTQLKGCSDAK